MRLSDWNSLLSDCESGALPASPIAAGLTSYAQYLQVSVLLSRSGNSIIVLERQDWTRGTAVRQLSSRVARKAKGVELEFGKGRQAHLRVEHLAQRAQRVRRGAQRDDGHGARRGEDALDAPQDDHRVHRRPEQA